MFLNNIGQPVFYQRHSMVNLHYAPLLLSNAQHLRHIKFPPNWKGTLYTSCAIMDQIKPVLQAKPQLKTKILEANKQTLVALQNDCEVQVTMIPLSQSDCRLLMFLIQDAFSTNLLAISRSNYLLDTFAENRLLRNLLNRHGIETLYIDDALYLTNGQRSGQSSSLKNHFNRIDLIKLLHLVTPRQVIGVAGQHLPRYLHDLCQCVDFDELAELF